MQLFLWSEGLSFEQFFKRESCAFVTISCARPGSSRGGLRVLCTVHCKFFPSYCWSHCRAQFRQKLTRRVPLGRGPVDRFLPRPLPWAGTGGTGTVRRSTKKSSVPTPSGLLST